MWQKWQNLRDICTCTHEYQYTTQTTCDERRHNAVLRTTEENITWPAFHNMHDKCDWQSLLWKDANIHNISRTFATNHSQYECQMRLANLSSDKMQILITYCALHNLSCTSHQLTRLSTRLIIRVNWNNGMRDNRACHGQLYILLRVQVIP